MNRDSKGSSTGMKQTLFQKVSIKQEVRGRKSHCIDHDTRLKSVETGRL